MILAVPIDGPPAFSIVFFPRQYCQTTPDRSRVRRPRRVPPMPSGRKLPRIPAFSILPSRPAPYRRGHHAHARPSPNRVAQGKENFCVAAPQLCPAQPPRIFLLFIGPILCRSCRSASSSPCYSQSGIYRTAAAHRESPRNTRTTQRGLGSTELVARPGGSRRAEVRPQPKTLQPQKTQKRPARPSAATKITSRRDAETQSPEGRR
jgi:hypothetical protein